MQSTQRTCVDANTIWKSGIRNTRVWIPLIQPNADSSTGILLSNRHEKKNGAVNVRDSARKWTWVTTQMQAQVRVKKRVKICVCLRLNDKRTLNWKFSSCLLRCSVCFVCMFIFFFFISAVVVILQTKTILKTKLIFVKLRFLAGKIQRSLRKNFINVSKISVICSLRLAKTL